jgi:hypothetical protein
VSALATSPFAFVYPLFSASGDSNAAETALLQFLAYTEYAAGAEGIRQFNGRRERRCGKPR